MDVTAQAPRIFRQKLWVHKWTNGEIHETCGPIRIGKDEDGTLTPTMHDWDRGGAWTKATTAVLIPPVYRLNGWYVRLICET